MISIRRGLFASGITRSRSIYSRPFTSWRREYEYFRKLEFTLKIAFSDALIQVSALFLLGGMGAFYDKQIILRGNFQFALGKTGNGNRDAVVVLVY